MRTHCPAILLGLLAATLAGCGAAELRPDKEVVVQTRTVEVKVPVKVSCLAAGDVPAVPATAMRRDGDLRQLAAGAASDVYALQEYAAKADALLRSCTAAP